MCRLACGHNREFPLATRPAISWILVIIHVPTCLSIFCKIIDTVLALEFINKDFELTKESVIKMTKHLDNLEISYNTILKEYKKRNG